MDTPHPTPDTARQADRHRRLFELLTQSRRQVPRPQRDLAPSAAIEAFAAMARASLDPDPRRPRG
ncbi:hypothetical protein [Pseudooceanicola sp. LIPI14-2-Ac024]|uniref:hypothetical protein n=1 Tax=Pseudooceanicola sp. LIPI14-2-Ac024 TaxID=3344875 RepID=UPI0035CFB83F